MAVVITDEGESTALAAVADCEGDTLKVEISSRNYTSCRYNDYNFLDIIAIDTIISESILTQ